MPLISDPDGLSQGGETSVAATTFASSAGAQTVITSVNVPAVTAGDYIEVRDATLAGNDGLYVVDSTVASTSITATKQALTGSVVNPADDAGSVTIRIFGTDANEKNVHIDPALKKFTFLASFGSVTVLDNDGVLGQSMYSFFKEEWKNDNDLIKFPFPMISITAEQYEFVEGWAPVDEVESTIATTPASDTRLLIRTAGWDEVDAAGFIVDQYFGVISLGNIDATDIAYAFFASESSSTAYNFDQAVNEAKQSIFSVDLTGAGTVAFATSSTLTTTTGDFVADGFLVGDSVFVQNAEDAANDGTYVITAVATLTLTVTGTPFTTNADDTTVILSVDRRATVLTNRIRTFGKTYDESTTTDIGVPSLTNQVYRFPLSEATDPVIDEQITTTIAALFIDIITTPIAPWDDMSITYYAADQDRSGFNPIGGDTPAPGDAQFGVIIDADVSQAQEDGGGIASAEETYAYVQARLSVATDIDDGAGTLNGDLAEELMTLASTGNTMTTILQTANHAGAGNGVYVDSFDSNDKNRVAFAETTVDTRTFPFVATGSIVFNANLSTDVDAVYRMFFTNDDTGDNSGRDYDTIDAITVQNDAAADIAGAVPQVPGGSSASFDFDYDGNLQRGTGSDATDAPITLVAIGLSTGQFVVATGTITRAENQTFSLVAALERNFLNP